MGSYRWKDWKAKASQKGLQLTKKHFIAVAKIVAKQDLSYDQREQLALDLASYFNKQNPRFDIQRFVNACRW